MLAGTVVVVALWVMVALGVLAPGLRPAGLSVPIVWPAFLLAAIVAWVQAVAWAPFGLGWVRIAAACAVLSVPVATAILGIEGLGLSQALVALMLAGMLPPAYAAGYVGVRMARRGDVPQWARLTRLARGFGDSVGRLRVRRAGFRSPMHAQVWFEWRRHGITLPFVTAVLLPVLVLMLSFGENDALPAWKAVATFLLVPPLVACGSVNTVSRNNPRVQDFYGVPPFDAVRPLSTQALVAAKLRMAAGSTLAAWGLLAAVIPPAVVLTGHGPGMAAAWEKFTAALGTGKAIGFVALAVLALVGLTWRMMTDSLVLNLTGRGWVINGTVSVLGVLGVFGYGFGIWLYNHPEYHADALEWAKAVLAGFVALKATAAYFVLRALVRRKLADRASVVWRLVAWLVVAGGTFVLIAWLLPEGALSLPVLAGTVALLTPLVRLSAAPLALNWNRHR
jgi:hypothetical protein